MISRLISSFVFRASCLASVLVPALLTCSLGAQNRPASRPASRAASRPYTSPPQVRRIDVPDFPGAYAIFGGTGRDDRGHIWIGVCAHGVKDPSARLFEYVPKTDELVAHSDVLSELKRLGLYRQGEGQMKIHSRIVQAADGCLYFASMDEQGEDQRAGKLPTWGSHLWRLRPAESATKPGAAGAAAAGAWEHLLSAPEGLIAVAAAGNHVYALGYWSHKLYHYDCASGKVDSVEVGSAGGHVTRNIFTDSSGCVYVPRVRLERGRQPAASLVQLDAELKQRAEWPMRNYFRGDLVNSHGIIGFAPVGEAVAFVTGNGWLAKVQTGADGMGALVDLGWFHRAGPSYTGSLFADAGGRYLMGALMRGQAAEWAVYDLQTKAQWTRSLAITQGERISLAQCWLYGSVSRDDDGRCYVVGAQPRGGEGMAPLLLQVTP